MNWEIVAWIIIGLMVALTGVAYLVAKFGPKEVERAAKPELPAEQPPTAPPATTETPTPTVEAPVETGLEVPEAAGSRMARLRRTG